MQQSIYILHLIRPSMLKASMPMFNTFIRKYYPKGVNTQLPPSSDNSANEQQFPVFKLFEIFGPLESKPNTTDWWVNHIYIVEQRQYLFSDFVRNIIRPFYIYLLDYIYTDIRNLIQQYLERHRQVIIEITTE